MRTIYLDNAATTALHPIVANAMEPYLAGFAGNPSSVHTLGRRARQAVERARGQVAAVIGVRDRELVFTSGGTEANYQALFGTFLASPKGKRHVVVSAVEHHAVLETCQWLTQFGATVTVVDPDATGRVHPDKVLHHVQANTALVAVMGVNNELGTIQPVETLAAQIKQAYPHVHVHSDMVQALGAIPLRLNQSRIDSAAFSAHKIHGPQGVGALFLRSETPWQPVLTGGAQERQRRAGTENVAGIVGFGAAAQRLAVDGEQRHRVIAALRDDLWKRLSDIPGARRNSPNSSVVPGILNVAFDGIRTDRLLARLDMEGVMASAGSACTAGTLQPSHVLLACGQSESQVMEAVRFSLSDMTSPDDILEAADVIRDVVHQLRLASMNG